MAKTRGTGLLMLWTDVASVLRTAAFVDEVRFRPSARRQQSSGGHVGRNYLLNGYRQIFPARRVRPHMRLDAGSPAVFRRITPPLGAAGR
jgi:hypothetical protein